MAKPQYRIHRRIGTASVTAGGQVTLDLPRDYDYESIFLRLSGTLNVTGAATSVRAEAPCQLVPRIEVIADGKNTIFSAPFWFAALGSYDRQGAIASGARLTTPPTAASVASYAVEALGSVDFMCVDGVHPKDTNFRPSGLSLFQIRFTFGQPGDPFVGGTVSFTGTPTVEIFASQLVEQPDPQTGQYANPLGLKKVSTQVAAVPATNSAQEIRLPAGNFIKSVVVRADGGTTAGEPSTAVVNGLILQNGVDVRFNLSGAQTRQKNNMDFGAITSGYYIADVTSKGRADINLSELWDCTNPAEPKLISDVTLGAATTTLTAVITEVIMAG